MLLAAAPRGRTGAQTDERARPDASAARQHSLVYRCNVKRSHLPWPHRQEQTCDTSWRNHQSDRTAVIFVDSENSGVRRHAWSRWASADRSERLSLPAR